MNRLKTTILLGGLTGLVIAVGYYFGGQNGALVAHPLIGEPKYEATAHMFIVNPFKPSLLMSLFLTHPPVEERVRKLEALKT